MVAIESKKNVITNGTANDGAVVEQNFVELYSNDGILAAEVNKISNEAITFTGDKTFSGTVNIQGPVNLSGQTNIATMLDPTTPNNGDLWFNSTAGLFKAYSGNVTKAFDPGAFPIGHRGSTAPVYASASTFSIARIADRDSSNTVNILKNSSTTVDISTNGFNGCLQSGFLTGTIGTGGVASNTITGISTSFTTDFIVGDVIWTSAGARRITVITSNTLLTVESTVTLSNGSQYKRGGEAPNTWYNLYSVQDSSNNVGLFLYTRNAAGGDALPDLNGYYYRQLSFAIRNDSTSSIIPFCITGGWPQKPEVLYITTFQQGVSTDPTNFAAAITPASYTAYSAASYIPPISRLGVFYITNTATCDIRLRKTGDTIEGISVNINGAGYQHAEIRWPTDNFQQIDIYRRAGSGAIHAYARGYVVTEVF